MSPYLEARSVSKIYQQGAVTVRAVEEVSFAVDHGEVALIAGPSGSGKSTLLSMVGCILRPSSGTICLDGSPVSDQKESDLPALRSSTFGFIFQSFNLFPFLTALENVELAMRLQGVPAKPRRSRALELLKSCGLAERATFHPSYLSGGEKQRVALARALAGDPMILLADEPTANLDSVVGEEVFGLLRRFAKDLRKVVVMVSHDPRAERFADRVFNLTDGRLAPLSSEPNAVV